MAPDLGTGRLVETAHGDGDLVGVDRVPEQEGAAADFFPLP